MLIILTSLFLFLRLFFNIQGILYRTFGPRKSWNPSRSRTAHIHIYELYGRQRPPGALMFFNNVSFLFLTRLMRPTSCNPCLDVRFVFFRVACAYASGMDSSAFYIKYKQCRPLADLAKSEEKRAVWERPCGKNRVLLHNRGRYRILLYTMHCIQVYMWLYYTKRGEQYFREEYINVSNVTENVAVNRYCSLCTAT